MLDMMARKRKKSDATAGPTPSRAGRTVFAYVPVELRQALDQMMRKTRRSLTAEIIVALEDHLARNGFWPPPSS